ncbi:aquaporin Z [Dictyobacter aurantiacus]|uniref:Aquaporin Z n=1 Tax=Dictyobacter aurantiacus TaxID=1936993 RepID=A0A401Z947_9CHLR|nr:aquaporin Z [Dictyobacter aurantiacus]
MRRCGAEAVGTYAYVFIGCGVKIAATNTNGTINLLLNALAFGLTLFIMTFALSHISAAPFNPAMTLGLAVSKRFPWRYVIPYWIAQCIGTIAASATHAWLLPKQARAGFYGATIPTVSYGKAVMIEVLITSFLMIVTLASSTDRRVSRAAIGLATGTTVAVCILFAGPLTGGSMNAARSLAPALFAGGAALKSLWIYWVGPLAGAILGALIYEGVRGGTRYATNIPEESAEKNEQT